MRRMTFNRYFLRLYLFNFFATLIAIFALIYLIDLVELSRRSVTDDQPFAVVALFSAMRVPAFVEQAFPFVVLFSSIFTLLSLNRRLELVVARAAGVSIWQILLPFIAGSIFLGLFATFVYNPLSASAKAYAARIEAGTDGVDLSSQAFQTPWLRQNENGVSSIIGAKQVAENGRVLSNATAFVIGRDGTVETRIDAPRAELVEQEWILYRPRVTRIGYTPRDLVEYRLPTSLRPEYIENRLADPETISIWELGSKIDVAASLGFNSMAFSMQYHTLIARPALFVAMTLLAATVATRFSRTGQSGRVFVSGVVAGFVLYVVTFLAQALGSNDVVPPIVAAWFPVLAAGLFGVTILLHQEDG
ncbi:LPS export ABC transporter permease LptG [Fulvimarina endophytica]|uniref:LPS export ABC transporter permease LptG n=1 Tax=Fulvimarina endophytica TaxID=2293836 RepID=A0A371XAY1_9HYPH|nr:LPS export ABC transporter permease LptG [Fulvimarina endophytica]RFC66204.1 LPS export ABC transporter permease LptG [Fulvimarina endophytica]